MSLCGHEWEDCGCQDKPLTIAAPPAQPEGGGTRAWVLSPGGVAKRAEPAAPPPGPGQDRGGFGRELCGLRFTQKWIGATYPAIFDHDWAQRIWKRLFCPRGWHLWDESAGSASHVLFCDACEISFGHLGEPW